MSVIKTLKTTQYAQIHNKPLQNLTDLQAIGLLSHLMSLPEDWTIFKTQLQDKFGRRAVDHAFKVLQKEGYLVSIKHREGKKNAYKYLVSDTPITPEQIQNEITGLQVMEIFSAVQNEQLKMSSTKSAAQNVHIQKKDLQKKNIQKKDIQKNISPSISEDRKMSIIHGFSSKYTRKVPVHEIAMYLLTDIENGVVDGRTENQFKALLEYRIQDYLKAQQGKPKTMKQQSVKKEAVPEEWHDGLRKALNEKPELTEEDLEAKKAEVQAKLAALRK